tara:strand:- start:334 stop:951 length:618 start_codon:yes stop_codon:yes gene_type:complete
MKVLVACEFSGVVREAFKRAGADATSCDLLDTEIPGKHHTGDVLDLAYSGDFDMMVAFPPCTHLSTTGACWFPEKIKDGRQQAGIDFFMAMVNAPIEKIAVENPVGIMSTQHEKPTQIIHPYYFGDPFQKETCLWLKNLKPLKHYKHDEFWNNKTWVDPGEFVHWEDKHGKVKRMPKWFSSANSKTRSKTFPGIADAMANQWCAD